MYTKAVNDNPADTSSAELHKFMHLVIWMHNASVYIEKLNETAADLLTLATDI